MSRAIYEIPEDAWKSAGHSVFIVPRDAEKNRVEQVMELAPSVILGPKALEKLGLESYRYQTYEDPTCGIYLTRLVDPITGRPAPVYAGTEEFVRDEKRVNALEIRQPMVRTEAGGVECTSTQTFGKGGIVTVGRVATEIDDVGYTFIYYTNPAGDIVSAAYRVRDGDKTCDAELSSGSLGIPKLKMNVDKGKLIFVSYGPGLVSHVTESGGGMKRAPVTDRRVRGVLFDEYFPYGLDVNVRATVEKMGHAVTERLSLGIFDVLMLESFRGRS